MKTGKNKLHPIDLDVHVLSCFPAKTAPYTLHEFRTTTNILHPISTTVQSCQMLGRLEEVR